MNQSSYKKGEETNLKKQANMLAFLDWLTPSF